MIWICDYIFYYRSLSSQNQLIDILQISDTVNIHLLYYLFMGMLIVCYTSAINIAGINGLEESLVIATSFIIHNMIQAGLFLFPISVSCVVP